MIKLKNGIVPPGRWHYKDRPYGAFYSKEKLFEAETNYRLENHIPVADVEGDITEWICEKWPNQCTGAGHLAADHPSRQEKMVDKVARWATKWMKWGFPLVLPDQAEKRAKICLQCPNNVGWETGCGSCTSHANRSLALVRQNREVKDFKKLKACSMTGWCNRTAVWGENKIEAPESAPDFCWLRSD